MAKVLKTAALIAGGAALIATGVGAVAFGSIAAISVAGVSTGTLLLASSALSAAASFLTKAPSVPSSQQDRLSATIDPRAFRKEVLGSTAMATDVRYEEWHGAKQDYCSWIIVAASHACTSIDQIWLNDELAWTAAGGVTSKFAGYFSVPHLTHEAGADDGYTFGSGKWNGAHRLTGCCWLHLQFKVTGNGKKAESPFNGGPVSRITIVGKGAKLYDPRRDSTVPGGAGPMRWNDQSTWAWSVDGVEIGENLPLQILRRLIGWRIRNPVTGELKLATGSGIPAKRIDMPSFIVAANLADEQVIRSAGGTEARYHGAGVVSEGDDTKSTFDTLCAGCCGRFRDTGGKLALAIAHNDLAEAALDDGLTDADVIGSFTFDRDPAMEASPNIVRGRYVDPSDASLYQLIDYPEVKVASVDGIDRVFPLDLGVVESPSQAQRIASQVLQRKQLARTFKAPFDERAWRWPVGKVVPFTFPLLGFDRQLFRVSSQDICDEGPNRGSCMMELTWEAQAIYAWDGSDAAPVQAVGAISYDPTMSAFAQALDRGAHQIVAQTVDYPATTTATTITIVPFSATLDDKRIIDLPAGQITGLDDASKYRLFYALEDATLAFVGPDGQAFIGVDGQEFAGIIPAGSYYAAPSDSLIDPGNSAFVIINLVTTANADGTTYPPAVPPPDGYGGSGYGGGGRYQQQVAQV